MAEHRRPRVVGGDPESTAAPDGERWRRAFDVGATTLVDVRIKHGDRSAWRHHGERAAYGVVLAGTLSVQYDRDERLTVGSEEFFRVPVGTAYPTAAEGDVHALVALVGPGERVVDASGPAAGGPVPRRAGRADLVGTSPLANLTRLTPFPDAPVQQVRGHAEGRVGSEWHHHGDNDVFGRVLAGEGYVERVSDGGVERALARAGEFFPVPAGLVHRDVNPSDEDQEYVLWLTGSDPRTVRVEGPGEGAGGTAPDGGE
ncbi:hypothetical protein BRC94_03045 [Halobacteriales archaeon QS_5_70_17]|nr:MAG: hypothetical protein BRC94_03045 [Halobacteriales archaeon QS_5_70_17]